MTANDRGGVRRLSFRRRFNPIALLSTNEDMFQNLQPVEIKSTPPMNSFSRDRENCTLYTRHVCPSDRKHDSPNITANKSRLITYRTIIIFRYGSAFKANALPSHLRPIICDKNVIYSCRAVLIFKVTMTIWVT